MSFDAYLLMTGLLVFCRASAALLSSPILGAGIPVMVRVGFSAIFTIAVCPYVDPLHGRMPQDVGEIAGMVLHEATWGLLLGMCVQALVLAAQMAGSFLDLQIGIGSSQILNPVSGVPVSVIAQFKYLLAVALLFLLNGHHLIIQAIVQSYHTQVAPIDSHDMQKTLLPFLGRLALLSLQIAAPAAAVTVIVDAGAGIVNKAVPQMQAYLVSMPAKIAAGLGALALGMPALVVAMQIGLEQLTLLFRHLLGI